MSIITFFLTDHVRTGSGVSLDGCEITQYSSNDSIRMEWKYTARAHSQPLTSLDCQGGRILTGRAFIFIFM